MKIIDADKLHYKQVYIQTEKGLRPALVVFAKEIRKMPEIPQLKAKVDPVKQGHWINISISANGNESSAECDLCGAIVHNNFSSIINYCPNCGAKMDEDRDYEYAVEQLEHDMTFEPTYNPEDGSM